MVCSVPGQKSPAVNCGSEILHAVSVTYNPYNQRIMLGERSLRESSVQVPAQSIAGFDEVRLVWTSSSQLVYIFKDRDSSASLGPCPA